VPSTLRRAAARTASVSAVGSPGADPPPFVINGTSLPDRAADTAQRRSGLQSPIAGNHVNRPLTERESSVDGPFPPYDT
jgi:hypothetical protein